MTYLIIGVVLLLVIGPLFAILPNARQRQQARMRAAARGAGINVSITSIEDPDPDPKRYVTASGRELDRQLPITAWGRPRKRPSDWRSRPQPAWAFARVNGSVEAGLPPGWSEVTPVSGEAVDALREQVVSALPGLPDDVVQVGEEGFVVSVYWREKDEEAFDTVVGFLQDAAGVAVFTQPGDGSTDDS